MSAWEIAYIISMGVAWPLIGLAVANWTGEFTLTDLVLSAVSSIIWPIMVGMLLLLGVGDKLVLWRKK